MALSNVSPLHEKPPGPATVTSIAGTGTQGAGGATQAVGAGQMRISMRWPRAAHRTYRALPPGARLPDTVPDVAPGANRMRVGAVCPSGLIHTVMVSPWYFPLNLRPWQMWRLSRIENSWDRDVALKQVLGTPPEIFRQANQLLQ